MNLTDAKASQLPKRFSRPFRSLRFYFLLLLAGVVTRPLFPDPNANGLSNNDSDVAEAMAKHSHAMKIAGFSKQVHRKHLASQMQRFDGWCLPTSGEIVLNLDATIQPVRGLKPQQIVCYVCRRGQFPYRAIGSYHWSTTYRILDDDTLAPITAKREFRVV